MTPTPTNQRTFQNVALYLSVMFGVSRIDCREVTITTGIAFAQYTAAIKVVYLEKGKRTHKRFILDHKPWLRLLPITKAVDPGDGLVSNGNGSRMSRYASCDPRWETDFEDANATTEFLLSIGVGDREVAHG